MSNFKAKMYQIQFCWGAYSALPDALAGLRGPTSKGRGGEGKGRGREGEEMGREGKRRGRMEAWEDGRGVEPRGGEGMTPHPFTPPH